MFKSVEAICAINNLREESLKERRLEEKFIDAT
jgi:hypothetical protein